MKEQQVITVNVENVSELIRQLEMNNRAEGAVYYDPVSGEYRMRVYCKKPRVRNSRETVYRMPGGWVKIAGLTRCFAKVQTSLKLEEKLSMLHKVYRMQREAIINHEIIDQI